MKIKQLHWWTFTEEPFEGCEIKCIACDAWLSHTVWRGIYRHCKGCGTGFLSLHCPECKGYLGHHTGPYEVRDPKLVLQQAIDGLKDVPVKDLQAKLEVRKREKPFYYKKRRA
jgi:hypothetical protein